MTRSAIVGLLLFACTEVSEADWSGSLAAPLDLCSAPKVQRLSLNSSASDDSGGAIFAWRDDRLTADGIWKSPIYAQRVDALGRVRWATDGILVGGPHNQDNPAMVEDGLGGVFLAWLDGRFANAPTIQAQHLDRDGAPLWGGEGTPACTTQVSAGLQVVRDISGGIIVVWSNGGDIRAQRLSSSGQRMWADGGVAICSAPEAQQFPVATADGEGGAVIGWYDYREPVDRAVYGQRIRSDGVVGWPEDGVRLSGSAQNIGIPRIATDGGGGGVVVWHADSKVYVQRVDASGTPRWASGGIVLSNPSKSEGNPMIVAGMHGDVFVGWQNFSWPMDLSLQHVDSLGEATWASTALRTGLVQSGPFVTPDGNGGVIAHWTEVLDGLGTVCAHRIAEDGVRLWGSEGVEVAHGSPDATVSWGPMVPDGAGGVIASWHTWFWTDPTHQESDLRAQAIDASGQLAGSSLVGVSNESGRGVFMLRQAFPNPTRGHSDVTLTLDREAHVMVEIYDLAARRVRRLFEGTLQAGSRTLRWDGLDDAGGPMPPSLYFARAQAGPLVRTVKIATLR